MMCLLPGTFVFVFVYDLCVTGCEIFVVCCTCALIAVLCLAKDTKLKMW
jgi:hypothetical protein